MVRKRYPPAYLRYVKKHPAVTIRLTAELKKVLDNSRGKMSYGEFVKKLLMGNQTVSKKVYENGYKKGYYEGYDAAMDIDHFTVPCPKCGEDMHFKYEDPDYWERVIAPRLEAAFKDFQHAKCPTAIVSRP
jgi:transcription initiation factor IIE alpha subunit